MEDHIQQPWDIEVEQLLTKYHGTLKECRDLVILHWLAEAGDAGPYVDWVLRCQHQPSSEVNKTLAWMLSSNIDVSELLPFKFEKKKVKGGRGRPPKLAAKMRDYLIFQNVSARMHDHGKGSYESAIAEVAQFRGLHERMVKSAYNRMKKKTQNE